jgi:hypothetical protein
MELKFQKKKIEILKATSGNVSLCLLFSCGGLKIINGEKLTKSSVDSMSYKCNTYKLI